MKLSAPWILFYREIEALFRKDPAVNVRFDAKTCTVELYVDGIDKAEALAELLPEKRTFGNVTVNIEIIPANLKKPSQLELFQKAFEGNPALSFIQSSDSGLFDLNYVVFKKEVVQYYADDIGDLNGLKSTLYQEIAKDVFEDVSGVYFCTEPTE